MHSFTNKDAYNPSREATYEDLFQIYSNEISNVVVEVQMRLNLNKNMWARTEQYTDVCIRIKNQDFQNSRIKKGVHLTYQDRFFIVDVFFLLRR